MYNIHRYIHAIRPSARVYRRCWPRWLTVVVLCDYLFLFIRFVSFLFFSFLFPPPSPQLLFLFFVYHPVCSTPIYIYMYIRVLYAYRYAVLIRTIVFQCRPRTIHAHVWSSLSRLLAVTLASLVKPTHQTIIRPVVRYFHLSNRVAAVNQKRDLQVLCTGLNARILK